MVVVDSPLDREPLELDSSSSSITSILQSYPYLTRIQDKYYNLELFHKNHPGGALPISCAYHRDATELFYSYHQFKNKNKISQILAQYEVIIPSSHHNNLIPSKNIFNWNETLSSEFYCDLYQSLTPYFQQHGLTITTQRILELFGLFLVTILQYYYFLFGNYITLFTFPISLFIFISNIAHDSTHFSLINIHWLNDLLSELIIFITPKYYWMYQHVIGHHCYTNIPNIDPDISISIYRHHPDLPHLPIHNYQSYFPLFIPIIRAPLFYLLSVRRCFQSDVFLGGHLLHDTPSSTLSRWSMIPSTLLFLFLMYILPLLTIGMSLKGLLFATLPYVIFNYYYMFVASLGHNLLENNSQQSSNFFIHQVLTSHNFATKSYLVYILSGALNFQIEHHLFPGVNSCHLPKIQPIVKAVCLKHNVFYHESPSYLVGWLGTLRHLEKLSKK